MYLLDETAQIPYLHLATQLLQPWPFHPQCRYVRMYRRNRHGHNHWKDNKRIDAFERIEKGTGAKNLMWLNVILVKLTSNQCQPISLLLLQRVAFCPYWGHLLSLLQCYLLATLTLFFSLPSSLGEGLICIIPLNSSVWRFLVRGHLKSCNGYLLPYARAQPGSTKPVSNNAQAHLLVMGSMNLHLHLNHKVCLFLPCCYDSVLSLESVKRSIFKTQGNHTNTSSFVHQQVQCKVFHKVFCVVT